MAQREFTAVYQKRGRWYVAWIEEIPGVNTQGRTKREARDNLTEALQLVLAANRELSSILPAETIREPIRVRMRVPA